MASAKDTMLEIIRQQPTDSSCEETMRELAFERMVGRGLKDARNGRTIDYENMKKRLHSWQR